jgi:hypothetical protein
MNLVDRRDPNATHALTYRRHGRHTSNDHSRSVSIYRQDGAIEVADECLQFPHVQASRHELSQHDCPPWPSCAPASPLQAAPTDGQIP